MKTCLETLQPELERSKITSVDNELYIEEQTVRLQELEEQCRELQGVLQQFIYKDTKRHKRWENKKHLVPSSNIMITLDSFVPLRECKPHNYFPHCSCKREIFPLSSKFPTCIWYACGKFSGRQRISLSTNFPSLTCTGRLVDKEILCFSTKQ